MSTRDPNNIVVVHGNEIHYSRNGGATFNKANTPELNMVVEDNVFMRHRPFAQDFEINHLSYLYDRINGAVYRSENGGEDWYKTLNNLPNHANNPWTSASLKSTPGKGGHLWFNHPANGLYRSIDKGDTWTKLSSVKRVKALAIGKAVYDGEYPTLYIVGELFGSPEGLYRSIDQGKTWSRLDNSETKFLLSGPRHLAADRSVFGKVYIGVDGMGVWQGTILDSNKVEIFKRGLDSFPNELPENIRLYPIPVDNILNIDFGTIKNQMIKWELFSIDGQLIRTGDGNQIEVRDLLKGQYVISFISEEGIVTKRIVKK